MILLIIFFIYLLLYPSSALSTGLYPYSKRLNNGYFILVSDTDITFTDSTLTEVKNKKDISVTLDEDNIGSTTVSQFPNEDSGYVLVILLQTLYIFSSNGNYLAQTGTSISNPKFTSFIMTKGHSNNEFYFTLIFGDCPNGDSTDTIIFQDGYYDSSSNQIQFPYSSQHQYKPFLPDTEKFYCMISCQEMIKDNQKYITCIYGNYNKLCVSSINLNNYENVTTLTAANEKVQYIKSAVLGEEKEKSMVCAYTVNTDLVCYSYDISTNTLTTIKCYNNNDKCGN